MTPKELLQFKLNGYSTLRDVLVMFEGEGQFPECDDMTAEQTETYYETLAQKLIWAAGRPS